MDYPKANKRLSFLYKKPINRFLSGCIMWILAILILAVYDPLMWSFFEEVGFYIGMILSGVIVFFGLTIIYFLARWADNQDSSN